MKYIEIKLSDTTCATEILLTGGAVKCRTDKITESLFREFKSEVTNLPGDVQNCGIVDLVGNDGIEDTVLVSQADAVELATVRGEKPKWKLAD